MLWSLKLIGSMIIKHEPPDLEDTAGMIDLASELERCRQGGCYALALIAGIDPFLEDLKRTEIMVYLDDGPLAAPKLFSKAYPRAQKSQRTLEAWT